MYPETETFDYDALRDLAGEAEGLLDDDLDQNHWARLKPGWGSSPASVLVSRLACSTCGDTLPLGGRS